MGTKRQGSRRSLGEDGRERGRFDLELERESGVHVPTVAWIDASGRDAGVVLFVEDVVYARHYRHPFRDRDFCGEVPSDVRGNFPVCCGIVCGVVIGHECAEE